MSVALVVCLNIGVDPPDVLKLAPCARAECWINPLLGPPAKALDAVGKALQAQYERWQPRARYKAALDPTLEDVRKLAVTCRRNAKHERILFHYNGHGVPRPTVNGEVWVFNKTYTQYIPLSVFDLHAWTGAPAIYVLDCSGAGHIINAFLAAGPDALGTGHLGSPAAGTGLSGNGLSNLLGPPGDADSRAAGSSGRGGAAAAAMLGITPNHSMSSLPPVSDGGPGDGDTEGGPVNRECIFLAACAAHEQLPCGADLPADLFTACLTTPIKTALRWFCLRSPLRLEVGLDPELADLIPGQQNNRKTPLGELNWIFTAITDTIAWNVLPRPFFQRLFRQDLLLASLFRNFLLAERIMRALGCTPVTSPALPSTAGHPMWAAWDMALEACLLQLPAMLAAEQQGQPGAFVPSSFFSHQLGAFEVWLEHGDAASPPEQLPVVLQVLLSQSHRLRALLLLGRFLDKGPWAVDLALAVGIFPYVLKLLQTTAADLRHILVFIWAKILAVDRSCQADLVKDNAFLYFLRFLDLPPAAGRDGSAEGQGQAGAGPGPEELALAAFALATICADHPRGQIACAASNMAPVCLAALPGAAAGVGGDPVRGDALLKWLALALANLWRGQPSATADAFVADAPSSLAPLLTHAQPEVRCAGVAALGALISVATGPGGAAPSPRDPQGARPPQGGSLDGPASGTTTPPEGMSQGGEASANSQPPNMPEALRHASERAVASQLLPLTADGSPLVRAELAVALARVAAAHPAHFHAAVTSWLRSGRTAGLGGGVSPSGDMHAGSVLPSGVSAAFGGPGSFGSTSVVPVAPRPRVAAPGGRPLSSYSYRLSVGNSFFANSESQLGYMSMGDFAAMPIPEAGAADEETHMPTLPPGASIVPSSGASPASPTGRPFSGAAPAPSPLRRSSSSALGSAERPIPAPMPVPQGHSARFAGVSVFADAATGGFLYSPTPPAASASVASGLGGSADSSGTASGLYASADAARIGGGIYAHLLESLITFATDPAPRVARVGRQALTALGIERVLGSNAGAAPGNGGGGGNDESGSSRHEGSLPGGSACPPGQARGGSNGGGAAWTRRLSSWMSGGVGKSGGGSDTGGPVGGSRHGSVSRTGSPERGGGGMLARGDDSVRGGSVDRERRMSDGNAAWLALQTGLTGSGAGSMRGGSAAALLAAACAEAHAQSSAPLPCLPASTTFERCAAHICRPLLIAPPAPPAAGSDGAPEAVPDAVGSVECMRFAVTGRTLVDDVDPEDADLEAAAAAAEELERTLRVATASAAENEAMGGGVAAPVQPQPPPRRAVAHVDAAGRRAARHAMMAARCARLVACPPPRTTELIAISPHRDGASAATSTTFDEPGRDTWRSSLDLQQRNSSDGAASASQAAWAIQALPSSAVTALALHPLRPVTAFGDASGTVRVWVRPDGGEATGRHGGPGAAVAAASAAVVGRLPLRISRSPVVALHLINSLDADDPLLLGGCDDGTVAVWKGWMPRLGGAAWHPPPTLATSWRALPGALPTRPTPRFGAAFSFQQAAGCLYVAGEGSLWGSASGGALHVWDLASEALADCVPLSTLAAGAGMTCLSSACGALILGGASDGRLLSFDLRSPARLLSSARLHTAPLRGVLLHPGGAAHTLVTASSAGELVWTDLRMLMEPLAVVQAFSQGGLTTLVAHPAAHVLAAGSAGERCVKLYDTGAVPLGTIKYHVAFLGQRMAPVTSLAFSPSDPVLAAGGADGLVALYGPPDGVGNAG
jgi:WD40 repeat protein